MLVSTSDSRPVTRYLKARSLFWGGGGEACLTGLLASGWVREPLKSHLSSNSCTAAAAIQHPGALSQAERGPAAPLQRAAAHIEPRAAVRPPMALPVGVRPSCDEGVGRGAQARRWSGGREGRPLRPELRNGCLTLGPWAPCPPPQRTQRDKDGGDRLRDLGLLHSAACGRECAGGRTGAAERVRAQTRARLGLVPGHLSPHLLHPSPCACRVAHADTPNANATVMYTVQSMDERACSVLRQPMASMAEAVRMAAGHRSI